MGFILTFYLRFINSMTLFFNHSTFATVVKSTEKQGLDFQFRLSCFAIGDFSLSSLTNEKIFHEDEDTIASLLGRDDIVGGLSLSDLVKAAGVELLLIDLDQTPFAKIDRIVAFHQTVITEIQEALRPIVDEDKEFEVKPELSVDIDTSEQSPYHPLSAITETPIDMEDISSPVLGSPVASPIPDSPDGVNSSISSDTLLPLLIYILIKVSRGLL
jgi:hypothetical protein